MTDIARHPTLVDEFVFRIPVVCLGKIVLAERCVTIHAAWVARDASMAVSFEPQNG